MEPFDSNIVKVLDKLAYEMFVVQQNFKIDCVCVDFTTKQAVHNCPKCLGTGKKIKIKKIMAACQNNKIPFSGLGVRERASGNVYYVNGKYPIYQENILVNENDVDVVQIADPLCSNNSKPVYFYCETTPKKHNVQLFLMNFKKIIGRI